VLTLKKAGSFPAFFMRVFHVFLYTQQTFLAALFFAAAAKQV
jgi:hypothetical protein